MNFKWYTNFLAHHPYIVVLAVTAFSTISLLTSLLTGKSPNFSDPQLGFEARGTNISKRLTTWENLLTAVKPPASLVINPEDLNLPKSTPTTTASTTAPTSPQPAHLKSWEVKAHGPHKYYNDLSLSDSDIGKISAWVPDNSTLQRHYATDRLAETLEREDWSSLMRSETLQTVDSLDEDFENYQHMEHNDHNDHIHADSDGFFCVAPDFSVYSRVVVIARDSSRSLFSLEMLLAICELQQSLISGAIYPDVCETIKKDKCCPPWSLPNYVAVLRNRSSCMEITEDDVAGTLSLLSECHEYIIQQSHSAMESAPFHCQKFNATFKIFNFLTDADFEPTNASLRASMIFFPVGRSASILSYFQSISTKLQTNDLVFGVAADFGAKGALFDDCLRRDTILMTGGIVVILLCLWSYTGSFFLTICTILAVAMTLVIAYFIYTFIFAINFFPFMNLLGVVLAIGLGADDAFILCKIWRCVKSEGAHSSTDKLLSTALSSSALSMSVTSLTTAAALFSNCVSPITAINCFSIFAGTAVLVNFCLMMSWLPACIVISEYWCLPHFIPISWRPAFNSYVAIVKSFILRVESWLERLVVQGVLIPRWFWVFAYVTLAIAASVAVFYRPKLRLPDSKSFHLFQSQHPFELYDSMYKHFFRFEKNGQDYWDEDDFKMPLRFVWGVYPVDNGNYMDPASRGDLVYDTKFNVAAKESQEWLLRFCQDLRHQPFYQPTFGLQLSNCFIESFKYWMSRRCKNGIRNVDHSPCCESSRFPYSQRVFSRCITQATAHLLATPSNIAPHSRAGPKYAPGKRGEIKVIIIEFDSNVTYSNSFTEIDHFYKSVESWFQAELLTAPPGLKNGWFVSDLGFYDLQLSLSEGTINAIVLSIGVALIVVFLTSLNVLISLFAVFTISSIIFVTVAFLVLLGWKLNVLESVAVTTAIGLSVDFSLHYGLHYRLSGEQLRQPAAVHALTRMCGPTSMGALTTGAAGAFMLFSSVLPYIQIGILVVVLMTVSWLYSTVFLISLLAVAGPQHGCGQFTRPSPAAWFRGPPEIKPPVPAMWSESTLSTSSGPAELHELDALTRGQRRSRRPRAQSPVLPDELDLECAEPSHS